MKIPWGKVYVIQTSCFRAVIEFKLTIISFTNDTSSDTFIIGISNKLQLNSILGCGAYHTPIDPQRELGHRDMMKCHLSMTNDTPILGHQMRNSISRSRYFG